MKRFFIVKVIWDNNELVYLINCSNQNFKNENLIVNITKINVFKSLRIVIGEKVFCNSTIVYLFQYMIQFFFFMTTNK